MNFKRIRDNYINQLWTKQMVRKACELGYISKDEYLVIVGESYD